MTLGVLLFFGFAGSTFSLAFGESPSYAVGFVLLAIVGGAVAADVWSIGRPEITGSAFLWWVGVVLLLIVFLPVYVYRRPKYQWRARHEKQLTRAQQLDPTNPFHDELKD